MKKRKKKLYKKEGICGKEFTDENKPNITG